jgi:hypothetical protein
MNPRARRADRASGPDGIDAGAVRPVPGWGTSPVLGTICSRIGCGFFPNQGTRASQFGNNPFPGREATVPKAGSCRSHPGICATGSQAQERGQAQGGAVRDHWRHRHLRSTKALRPVDALFRLPSPGAAECAAGKGYGHFLDASYDRFGRWFDPNRRRLLTVGRAVRLDLAPRRCQLGCLMLRLILTVFLGAAAISVLLAAWGAAEQKRRLATEGPAATDFVQWRPLQKPKQYTTIRKPFVVGGEARI